MAFNDTWFETRLLRYFQLKLEELWKKHGVFCFGEYQRRIFVLIDDIISPCYPSDGLDMISYDSMLFVWHFSIMHLDDQKSDWHILNMITVINRI